ncbi:MAG TPA: hypothetical protein VIK04_02410 [Solirubrobacteraceae bacterium]
MAADRDSADGNSADGDTAGAGPAVPPGWSLTALMLGHKRVSAASIVVVLALIVVTVLTTVANPARAPLTDASTCSAWAAGTGAQKVAYALVYIGEYGGGPDTTRTARTLVTTIDTECVRASYLGEADDVSILASIRHAF